MGWRRRRRKARGFECFNTVQKKSVQVRSIMKLLNVSLWRSGRVRARQLDLKLPLATVFQTEGVTFLHASSQSWLPHPRHQDFTALPM